MAVAISEREEHTQHDQTRPVSWSWKKRERKGQIPVEIFTDFRYDIRVALLCLRLAICEYILISENLHFPMSPPRYTVCAMKGREMQRSESKK